MRPFQFSIQFQVFISILIQCSFYNLHAQTRKPMDHSIYGDWNTIAGVQISADGNWAAYEVNPAIGDGTLYLVNLQDSAVKKFERGFGARFSRESDYLVFKIKPPYEDSRNGRNDNQKKIKVKRDSLGLCRLPSCLLSKFPRVEKFSVPH